ncbi:response regulator [Roseiconus nitratireducens]|uniref:Response regulator n=1 Tax=Roseiconus nitratireducens TaxID=2605748 RepID=A0A5M6DAF3_9BACT|nr:response regulator [Roseiconus nitratireducens]
MNSTTLIRFSRSCPTCGRRIQIRSSLLGRTVACRHCNAEFVAMANDESVGQVDESDRLMARVESALVRSQAALSVGRSTANLS